ncbi:MAG: hypothetical protein V4553_21775 [Bacteroidota bacterium]
MKNILFFALTITLGSLACKQADVAAETGLTGKWELRTVNQGYSGKVIDYPIGNGQRLIFSGDTYKIMAHDTVKKAGTFAVVKEISQVYKTAGTCIIYDNDRNRIKTFIEVDGNTLRISPDAYDGGYSSYQRIDGSVVD